MQAPVVLIVTPEIYDLLSETPRHSFWDHLWAFSFHRNAVGQSLDFVTESNTSSFLLLHFGGPSEDLMPIVVIIIIIGFWQPSAFLQYFNISSCSCNQSRAASTRSNRTYTSVWCQLRWGCLSHQMWGKRLASYIQHDTLMRIWHQHDEKHGTADTLNQMQCG